MASDEIRQTAYRLIAQYGEDAGTVATLRAAEFAAMGDVAALADWDEIIAVIAAYDAGNDEAPRH